ncbi:MAG TPA: hypothetical protein VF258_10805, partial [Luteolibacter sp.]
MKFCPSRLIQATDAVNDPTARVFLAVASVRKLISRLAVGGAFCGLSLTAQAIPAFTWDFKTFYPHAEALQASLTPDQTASLAQFNAISKYQVGMSNATGAGLTLAELDEVAAMPAYFVSRGIVVDGGGQTAQPDLSQPADFSGDFVTKLIRLTDLYKKATAAQAPQLESVYSTLIEHFLNQNYLPGGTPIDKLPLGNGYSWDERGWKTLRMMHKLSADKRDLY